MIDPTGSSLIDEERERTKSSLLRALEQAVNAGIITPQEIARTGKVKGRNVAPLPQFTFPDSGITVGIRKLGPFTLDKIRVGLTKKMSPPEPPMVRVNYGTEEEPDWKWEPNPADPTYKQSLVDHEASLDQAMGMELIEKIIKFAVDVEADEAEVAIAKEFLIDLGNDPQEVNALSSHEVYVKYVCIKSPRDLTELQSYVTGMSIPTEVSVQAHVDSFRSEIPGEASIPVSSAFVGNEIRDIT